MIFTGNDKITAERALAIGLINRVVPSGQHLQATIDMARQIAVMDTHVMALSKQAINRAYEIMGMREALNTAVDLECRDHVTRYAGRHKIQRSCEVEGSKGGSIAWRDARFD